MKSPSRCCKTLHPQCIVNTTLRLVNWGQLANLHRIYGILSFRTTWFEQRNDMSSNTERHEFKHETTWFEQTWYEWRNDMIWKTKRHDLKTKRHDLDDLLWSCRFVVKFVNFVRKNGRKWGWSGWRLINMSGSCYKKQNRFIMYTFRDIQKSATILVPINKPKWMYNVSRLSRKSTFFPPPKKIDLGEVNCILKIWSLYDQKQFFWIFG